MDSGRSQWSIGSLPFLLFSAEFNHNINLFKFVAHNLPQSSSVETILVYFQVFVSPLMFSYLGDRSLSGVSQPIHCQHNTHAEPSTACVTACELSECSGSAVVARLSSHPAFECFNLQSVKYVLPYQQPVTLTETSLDDLAGPKLACFKESRKKMPLSGRKSWWKGIIHSLFTFHMKQITSLPTTSGVFQFLTVTSITGVTFDVSLSVTTATLINGCAYAVIQNIHVSTNQ